MARFTTDYTETFTVRAPSQVACAYFGDLDRIAENLEGVEHVEKIDDGVLWVRMQPLSRGPVTFRGEYRCRYSSPADGLLVWEPAGPGNLQMRGEARFAPAGTSETRVEFHQAIEAEIAISRFLSLVATPIVDLEMRRLLRRYLERARESLAARAG
jgi:carbon monoxide dehydrogenase subunit G